MLRTLPLLFGSALAWLVLLSLSGRRKPLDLVERLLSWLGAPTSTERVASWMQGRADALIFVAAVLAAVAVLGVLQGTAMCSNTTYGVTAIAAAAALWQQVGAPAGWLVATALTLAVLGGWADRAVIAGLFVLSGPAFGLLLAPVLLLWRVLGFGPVRRADATPLPPTGAELRAVSTSDREIEQNDWPDEAQLIRPVTDWNDD